MRAKKREGAKKAKRRAKGLKPENTRTLRDVRTTRSVSPPGGPVPIPYPSAG